MKSFRKWLSRYLIADLPERVFCLEREFKKSQMTLASVLTDVYKVVTDLKSADEKIEEKIKVISRVVSTKASISK